MKRISPQPLNHGKALKESSIFDCRRNSSSGSDGFYANVHVSGIENKDSVARLDGAMNIHDDIRVSSALQNPTHCKEVADSILDEAVTANASNISMSFLANAGNLKMPIRHSRQISKSFNRFGIAMHWLKSNISSSKPVEELCALLDISAATLNRLFHAHLGMSAKYVVHQHRMMEAKRLLLDKTLSVKEIAYNLGYRHPNDLSRAYLRFFNKRPRNPLGRISVKAEAKAA